MLQRAAAGSPDCHIAVDVIIASHEPEHNGREAGPDANRGHGDLDGGQCDIGLLGEQVVDFERLADQLKQRFLAEFEVIRRLISRFIRQV